METQRSAKKGLLLLAFGVLISTLGFSLMAHAGDESSVLKASDLIGMKVQGADDKKLGDIKDLVIDPEDGGVQYAVLDFGGFAGSRRQILCRTMGSTAVGHKERRFGWMFKKMI